MNVASVTAIIVAIISVVGILIYGLGGKSRENTNEAIMQENISLRNQLGDAKGELATAAVRATKAEENEQFAKELAQSRPDFNKLSVQLTDQHREILNSFKQLTEGISKLAVTIAKDRGHGNG